MKANLLGRILRAKATVFVGLAMLVAVVLGVASTAQAHTGFAGLFHLNHPNTVSNFFTELRGNVAGSILTIQNVGAGPALDLQVGSGKTPMKVNSTTKVANLNADQIDGNDSRAFLKSKLYVSGNQSQQDPLLRGDLDVYHTKCDAGDLPLSGGIANLGELEDTATDVTVLNSYPESGGWTVAIRNTGPSEAASAVVVCADQ